MTKHTRKPIPWAAVGVVLAAAPFTWTIVVMIRVFAQLRDPDTAAGKGVDLSLATHPALAACVGVGLLLVLVRNRRRRRGGRGT